MTGENAYGTGMPLIAGIQGESSLLVEYADTAVAQRSGEVPVLATPRLVALFEEAAIDALSGQLNENQTSVGMRVQIDHLAPSGIGSTIRARATLQAVEGRRLTFTAVATELDNVIANATITRVIVNTKQFLERLA